jgi:hypothetical protein
MLDDKDIQKLIKAQKEIFVTKEEFEGLINIVATKEELKGVEEKLSGVEKRLVEKLNVIDKKMDKVDVIEKEVGYIRNTFSIPVLKK